MRVPVRPLGLALALVRRVHVELHRQALGDEVLLGERPRQCDAVLVGQFRIRRQRQHDLAGDLRVLALLRRLRRVPQHRAVGEPRIRAVGQQHLVVLGRVAVPEVEHLAGALRRDGGALVVRRRAHGAAAGAAGDVARAGKLDGHARHLDRSLGCFASSHCRAMHIASARFRSHSVPLVQNPLRGSSW